MSIAHASVVGSAGSGLWNIDLKPASASHLSVQPPSSGGGVEPWVWVGVGPSTLLGPEGSVALQPCFLAGHGCLDLFVWVVVVAFVS